MPVSAKVKALAILPACMSISLAESLPAAYAAWPKDPRVDRIRFPSNPSRKDWLK